MIDRQTTKWLNYCSPLFRGRFDFVAGEDAPRMDSWANALVLLGGWYWVRIEGGHNLRRSVTSRIPSLDDPIVGTADGPAATIKTNWLVGHAAASRYLYRVTAVGGGGVEDDGRTAVREVATEADGTLTGLLPNRVADLTVTPQSNGSFVLRWNYAATGQAAAPSVFRVYSDSGTGTMDWVAPLGSVVYSTGVPSYLYTTAVLAGAGDTAVLFAVRAETTTGARERNAMLIPAVGRTTAPYGTIGTHGASEASQQMILPLGPPT
jgi:hypothetical protein